MAPTPPSSETAVVRGKHSAAGSVSFGGSDGLVWLLADAKSTASTGARVRRLGGARAAFSGVGEPHSSTVVLVAYPDGRAVCEWGVTSSRRRTSSRRSALLPPSVSSVTRRRHRPCSGDLSDPLDLVIRIPRA